MFALIPMGASAGVYLYIGALLLLCLLPFVLGSLRGSLDLFEIIYPISISYFLLFGFRALLVLLEPWATSVSLNLSLINVAEYIPLALQYVISGFSALLFGYYSGVGTRLAQILPRTRWVQGTVSSLGRVFPVFAVGFIAQFYLWHRGDVPAVGEGTPLNDPITHISFLGYYGLALGLILFITTQPKRRALLLPAISFMLVLETWYVFVTLQRSNLILLLLIAGMSLHYFRRRIPARQLVLVALLFVCFLFPLTEQFRKVYWFSHQPTEPEFLTSYRTAFEDLQESGGWGPYLRNSVVTFSNRLHGLDSLMVSLYKTPATIPFLRGETLGNLFIGTFIPRFIWPEKPKIYFSDTFARDYWGLPPYIHAAIAVSQIGELYLNYGLVGVLLGMFCLGVLYRILYVYLVMQQSSSLGAFLYIFVFSSVIFIDRELAVVYGTLIKRMVVLLFVCAFVYQRGSRKSRLQGESLRR